MKRKLYSATSYFLLATLFMCGCKNNETNFFNDGEQPQLSIFSNNSNNVLSCLIDGKPWRTPDRTSSVFTPNTRYEVYISKQITNSLQDTLRFSWTGFFVNELQNGGMLTLTLPVNKNFSAQDLNRFAMKRLQIDTTNGYFESSIPGMGNVNTKGAGTIYFHTARFDSVGPRTYVGKISGLFTANFFPAKITNGRFDHFINTRQIFF